MKITKLSMITSAVIAATLSASAVAGHHEEKICNTICFSSSRPPRREDLDGI